MPPNAESEWIDLLGQVGLMHLRMTAEHRHQDRDADTAADRPDHVEQARRRAHLLLRDRSQAERSHRDKNESRSDPAIETGQRDVPEIDLRIEMSHIPGAIAA